MRDIYRKLQVTCGLVILTGPLCLMASAQTYVDLEAERAAAQAAGMSAPSSAPASAASDPYGAQPTQAYPATSYGVNNAPAATSGIAPAASSAQAAPAVSSAPVSGPSGPVDVGGLFLQIQQLQQQIMELNGKVEEQAYELGTLKEQSLQRYMDLDKRLSGGAAPPATTGAPGASNTNVPPQKQGAINAAAPLPAPATQTRSASAAPGKEQAGEADAYRAAYALVEKRQFPQAIPAFKQFLQKYPVGTYAGNAHYWLGELYLVSTPPDLESSRQSFALLLSQFPDNAKAPDALYKLGKVQFMKGNREKAKEYLDLVISQYGGTNNAAVQMAKDFIAQNY